MKAKKIFLIIGIILMLAFIVGVILYYVPNVTKINVTLNAVTLDENGDEIGTVQIAMQGNKQDYLFQEDRVDLSISPFDNLVNITPSNQDGIAGVVHPIRSGDYSLVYYGASVQTTVNVADAYAFCTLAFSDDLDCWAFRRYENGKETYYVASVSGNYTTKELVAFFRGLIAN